MTWRNLVRVVGMSSLIALSVYPAGESVVSALASESVQTQVSSVVTAHDIPSDVLEGSWASCSLPRRENLDADGQHAYDVIVHPGSRYATGLSRPVAMWVYSPLMAEHIFPASTYLRFGTEKDQRLTELVILATARELRSQHEWTAHEPAAERAGLQPEIIDFVKRRGELDTAGELPGLNERELIIIAFAREVVTEEKVTSATFSRVLKLVRRTRCDGFSWASGVLQLRQYNPQDVRRAAITGKRASPTRLLVTGAGEHVFAPGG